MHPEPIVDAVSSTGTPCPLHPGSPSITSCGRCGTFMCGTCVGPEGATLCPPCAAQSFTFPITRSEWSVSWLFSVCLDAFKPQWLMLSVAFVVFIVSYYVLAILAGGVGALIGAGIGQALGEGGDRKSTRLNSSHVKISYAVFCLKK